MNDGEQWLTRRLGELVVPQRSVVEPQTLPPDTRYVGLEHIESGTGMHRSVALSEAGLRSAKFQFERRDILYGKLRPNLRKVAVAQCSGVCSTDLIPLRPRHPASAFLLAFQLRSPMFTSRVMRVVAGQNLPRVSVADLLWIEIPVPPVTKVAQLQELAELLDEARATAFELDQRVRHMQDAATSLLYPRPGRNNR
jgi:type I restriction enzyme S subunit